MRVPALGSRADALDRLASTELDLLIVGGGITGAGIALDATGRGLKVGLVEGRDFASGTSSKSSKLIHGGLRYLEQRDFALVREASTERELLARLAPHLVEPIPFVIPVSRRSIRAKFGVGLWTYDALASFKNLHVHRYLEREEVEQRVPALPKEKLRGGFLFYDSKTDDVRLVMENLIQARRFGATVVNHAPARDLESSESMCEATVEDSLTGAELRIRAKKIIVAAGVWGDRVNSLIDPGIEARLRPSKGIHLIFRRDAIPLGESAAFIPDVERKRMLFVIPWLDAILVGTTDTPYEGEIDSPSVEPQDRDYCLDALNAAFELDLGVEDIAGAYAGLRPLIAGKAGATADLSRRHRVFDIAPGIAGITGGKMTTYRRMAVDAVDHVIEDLAPGAKSRTRWIRLGVSDLDALQDAVARRARALEVDPVAADNLVRAYGDRAFEVLDVVDEFPELAAPLGPGTLPIGAEAVYCATAEMAVHLSDFLARRARLAITDHSAGIGPGSRAVELMAQVHGWDSERSATEVAAHRAAVERERGLPLSTAPAPPAGDAARRTG